MPVVPRCGMLGEHVCLRNGPCCAGVDSTCVCVVAIMQQWINTWLILKYFIPPFPAHQNVPPKKLMN